MNPQTTPDTAQLRVWHLHSRRHHRVECRCKNCKTDGREPCSETDPCGTCREAHDKEVRRCQQLA